jgi:RHS repeat-associated protein
MLRSTSQRYLDFGYDGQGRLTSVTDYTGRSVGYGYDAFDNLTVFTDTRDLAWTYVYTSAGGGSGTPHYLHEIIDPDGRVVERTFFDAGGRAYRQEDGLDHPLVEIKYNLDGTRVVTEAGMVITDTYNAQNLLVGQADAQGNSQDFTFDNYFNRTRVIDANDNPTAYARNQFGYTTAITDALDHTTVYTYDESTNNLIGVEDARHIITRYEYEGNRLITTTLNFKDGQFNPNVPDEDVQTVYTYNDWGQVTSVTDPRSKTTTYGYDSLGQRTVITDALENRTRFEYDNLGRVVTTTDALDKVTVNQYDAGDNLVRVTENYLAGQPQNYLNEYNLLTQYAYGGAGQRTLITDTLSRVTRNEYDPAGRLMTTTVNYLPGQPEDYLNQYNLITTYEYDTAGRLFRTIDHRGPGARETRTIYDDLGRVWKTIVNYVDGNYSSGDPDADIVTEYQYDANGNLVRTIDTPGRATQTDYDALNRPITVTVNYENGIFDPQVPDQDVQTAYTYDAVGNQIRITNPKSQITKYDYDDLNRVITVTNPLDGQTVYAYDAAGNRTRVTDPNQHITTYAYDDLNRVVTTTNHLEGRTVVAYDAVGNRMGVTDARQNRTVYKYDSLYRLAEVRQDYLDGIPEGGPQSGDLVTTFSYDPLGNRTGVTDAESHTTSYGYDALNRATLITNTMEYTLGYSYDAWGDRASATDENGHTTSYSYDDLGRVTRIEDAEGITSTYTYDGLGNRLSVINGENERTRYGYDDLNRLEAITDALGYVLGYDTRYRYDALGNREFMIDAEGVETRYEYDDLNRLVAVTENYAQGQGSDQETNVRTSYGYDAVGNRTVITNARAYTTTYGYDELNRLERVTDAPGHETRYGYDAVGNRTVITDANYLAGQGGAVTIYLYDHVNRLTGIDYAAPEADVTFTYDKVGNRLTMTDGTGLTTYVYDDLYRLESVTDGSGQAVGYTYYPAGNRHTMTYPSGQVITYTYDMANRLDTVTDWDGGVYDYTFDDAHRLKQIVLPNTLAGTGAITSTYDYDDAGRLVALTHASAAETLASYEYALDKIGNRTSLTETLVTPLDLPGVPAPPDGVTAIFIYDGDGNRVAQTINGMTTQLILDRTGLPEVIATGAGDTYLHLPGVIVTQNESGKRRYLLSDGLGSVRHVVDATAQVVTYHEFDPYGNPMQNGGSPYGYTGEWWQGEVSLLYLRARWYDAETGRFLTRDPWSGDTLRPLSLNLYLYTGANPINRIDPSGRFSNDVIAATFGVSSFDQVMNIFQQNGKWGFLRLLQDAQEGDILAVGYEGKPAPEIVQPGRFVCRNGKIETDYVYDFKQFLEFLQYARFNVAAKWWRANTIDWYFLNGGGPSKGTPSAPAWWNGGYTDWKDWTNLPDFYMVSGAPSAGGRLSGPQITGRIGVGIVAQTSYIVDRYGRQYWGWSIGVGVGLPIDLSYAEGYVGQWNYDILTNGGPVVVKSHPASREAIENFLVRAPFGETVWGDLGLGIGGSVSFGGAAALFGEGLAGVSWSGGQTYFLDAIGNPDLAWDWLDRVPVIQISDIILDNNSISGCECQ